MLCWCLVVILGQVSLSTGLDPEGYGNVADAVKRVAEGVQKYQNWVDTPSDKSYQERYMIHVAPKSESCFFLENLMEGFVLNIHYVVLNTKNGAQLDISMRLRDPDKRLITFQPRKKESHYTDYKVPKTGDYEMCMNNRYSMFESKKVMWEIDVIGDEDVPGSKDNMEIVANATHAEYMETADRVSKAVRKVRGYMAKARHQQWWVSTKVGKDMERLRSITGMIDKWSGAYIFLVCIVGLGQVYILRRFFEVKPPTTNVKTRI